jgi:hypothetical protein
VSDRTDQASQQAAGRVTPVEPRPESYFGPSRDVAWGDVGDLDARQLGADADPLAAIADLSWSMLTVPIDVSGFADQALAWDDAFWADESALFADATAAGAEWSALPPEAEPAAALERRPDDAALASTPAVIERRRPVLDGPPSITAAENPAEPTDVAGGRSDRADGHAARKTARLADAPAGVASSIARQMPSTQRPADRIQGPAPEVDQAFDAEPQATVQFAGAPPDLFGSPPSPPDRRAPVTPSVEYIQRHAAEPSMPAEAAAGPAQAGAPFAAIRSDPAAAPADVRSEPAAAAPSAATPAPPQPVADRGNREAASPPNAAFPPLLAAGDRQGHVTPTDAATVEPRSTRHSTETATVPLRAPPAPTGSYGVEPATPVISGPRPPRDAHPNPPDSVGVSEPSAAALRDAVPHEPHSLLAKWHAFYLPHSVNELEPLATWRSMYLPGPSPTAPHRERATEADQSTGADQSSVGEVPAIPKAQGAIAPLVQGAIVPEVPDAISPDALPVVPAAGAVATPAAGETTVREDISLPVIAPPVPSSVTRSIKAEPDIADSGERSVVDLHELAVSPTAADETIQLRGVPGARQPVPPSPPQSERAASIKPSERSIEESPRHEQRVAPHASVAHGDKPIDGSRGDQNGAAAAVFDDTVHPRPAREAASLSPRPVREAGQPFDAPPAPGPDITPEGLTLEGWHQPDEPTIVVSSGVSQIAEASDVPGRPGSPPAAVAAAARHAVQAAQPVLPARQVPPVLGSPPSNRLPMPPHPGSDEVGRTPELADRVERIPADRRRDDPAAEAAIAAKQAAWADHPSPSELHAVLEERDDLAAEAAIAAKQVAEADHSSPSELHAVLQAHSGRAAAERHVRLAEALGIEPAVASSGVPTSERSRRQTSSREIGPEGFRQAAADHVPSHQRAAPPARPGVPVVHPRDIEVDQSPDHSKSGLQAAGPGEAAADSFIVGDRRADHVPLHERAVPPRRLDVAAIRPRDQEADQPRDHSISRPQTTGPGEVAAGSFVVGAPHAETPPSAARSMPVRPRTEMAVTPNDPRRDVDRPAGRKANGEAPPIRVSIGRITVEAPSASALPPPFRRPRPTLSLNDYLERRRRSE